MSETKVPSIPAPTDANLRDVARAIKGLLDVREGLIGDPLDSVIKFRDLVDAGVISVSLRQRGGGPAGLVVIPSPGDDGYDPTKDLTPPPAPQGFTATGLFASVNLSWLLPNIPNLAYTEIWRADSNSLGSAIRIATTPTSMYSDFIGGSATKYYWVRFVTQANVVGPYNGTEGTPGTTSPDPAYLLELLTGSITESQLYQGLQSRIDLIDGAESLNGSVNARIANEAYVRGQALLAEAASRLSGDESLQNQIDLLSSGTSGDLSSLISTVNTETAARIAADLAESDARALADTTINTAIDAEETARTIGDGVLSAITGALGTSLTGVSASIKQESDVRQGADSASVSQTLALYTQVQNAAGALVVEQESRVQGDSVSVAQTTTLAARVDLGNAQNAAGLVVEQEARASADGSLAGQVVSLAAQAGDNLAALQVEQSVRSSDSLSLAAQATALAVTFNGTAAGLSVEQAARASADEVSASQISSLSASSGGLAAAIASEQTVRIADNAATTSLVTGLASRVDVGDSVNAAAIQQEQSTRADADSAQAASTYVLSAAVGDNASAIRIEQDARTSDVEALASQSETVAAASGTALAGVVLEQAARASADSASASQSQQLAAKMGETIAGLLSEQSVSVDRDAALVSQTNQLVVSLGQAASGIAVEQSARADADAAVAQQINGVAAQFSTSAAGVEQEANVRADADSAVATQVTTLVADTDLNTAGLQVEQAVRANETSAVASQTTSLFAATGANVAALRTEESVRTQSDSSVVSQVTTLAAGAGESLSALSAERQVRFSDDEAVAKDVLALSVSTGTAASGLREERAVRASQDEAVARQVLDLTSATVTTSAALREESLTRSDNEGSVASQINTLQASSGSNTAAIQTEVNVRSSETGNLFAKYSVKIDNAGHIAGFGLLSTSNDAAPTSEFGIRADKFWVAGASTASATAPSTNLYKGKVWLDTSVTPNVTRYYTGSAWSTTPQANVFAVLNVPGTINGVSVPAGVYIDTAFIAKATINAAQIGSVRADTIQAGYTSSVDIESATFFGSDFYIGGTVTYQYNDPTDVTRKTGIASVSNPNIALKTTGAEFEVNYFKIKNSGNLTTPFEVVNNTVRVTRAAIGTLTATNINGAGLTVTGGDIVEYGWPTAGLSGFYLGPSGFLLGNANGNGNYFQYDQTTGTISATGLSITGGTATFSGSLNVKSASSGERMEITSSAIKVFDSSGALRVQIGNLS